MVRSCFTGLGSAGVAGSAGFGIEFGRVGIFFSLLERIGMGVFFFFYFEALSSGVSVS